MEAFGMYLLKSAIWLTGFTLVFLLFLRNERYFQLNRVYLLAGIVATVVFPFFTWHYAVILPPMPEAEILPEFPQEATVYAPIPEEKIPFYWWLYAIGTAVLAFRMIWQTGKVIHKLRRTGYVKSGSVKLVRTPEYPASFSFFSFVFVNPSTSDIETKEIVNHECGHIEKRHWFDLLLVELLRMMQWFNPFAWIYAHLVRQNHEYLADELALQRTSNPAIYKSALLNQMLGVPVISLANSFSYSLNKKRFTMMKKSIESPFRKLKLLMVLPVTAMIFYAFAKPEYEYQTPVSTSEDQKVQQNNVLSEFLIIVETTNEGIKLTGKEGCVWKELSFNVPMTKKSQSIDKFGMTDAKTKEESPGSSFLFIVSKTETGLIFRGLKGTAWENLSFSCPEGKCRQAINQNGMVAIEPAERNTSLSDVKVVGYGKLSDKEKNDPFLFRSTDTHEARNPLIILDGKEITKDEKDRINMNDVLSISVLKDESATSLYGEKAKDGVIIITTKRGSGTVADKDAPAIRIGFGQMYNGGDHTLKYSEADEKPEFPGGMREMQKFIQMNLKYPVIAQELGATGTALVRFVISRNGQIDEALVVNDVHPSLKAEAIRVIKKMPTWGSGKEDGKAVDIACTIPFKFMLKGVDSQNETLQGDFEEIVVVGYGGTSRLDTTYKYGPGEERPFIKVEQMPEYPGGPQEMQKFIQNNLKYPAEAKSKGIEGMVVVQFVISAEGKIGSIKVMRGISQECDEEAIRVVKAMPDWTPGKQGGKNVSVYYTLPFRFVLNQTGIQEAEKRFAKVEQMPEYPGGLKEMQKFIVENMKYPAEAKAKGIQGVVILQFVVSPEGKVNNIKVARGVGSGCDEEAIRVLKLMPDWIPGKQDGKNVSVDFTLPFKFVMTKDK